MSNDPFSSFDYDELIGLRDRVAAELARRDRIAGVSPDTLIGLRNQIAAGQAGDPDDRSARLRAAVAAVVAAVVAAATELEIETTAGAARGKGGSNL